MKVKTVLVAAVAGSVGYVLGTRAGRERFEEIKARANDLAHSQQAQDAAAKVAASCACWLRPRSRRPPGRCPTPSRTS
jgi:hypothetical protein